MATTTYTRTLTDTITTTLSYSLITTDAQVQIRINSYTMKYSPGLGRAYEWMPMVTVYSSSGTRLGYINVNQPNSNTATVYTVPKATSETMRTVNKVIVTIPRKSSAQTVTLVDATCQFDSVDGNYSYFASKNYSHTIPALPTYTVSYANGGHGTAPASQTKSYNVTLTLRPAIATTNHYVFDKWKATNGTTYSASGSYTANAATTMTATWHAPYTVSYNANGGTSTPATQTSDYNANTTLAKAISHNTTSPGSYTITLNGNGASNPSALTSTRTTSYAFSKWKASNGTLYNASASYTAKTSTTMTAQWTTSETRQAKTLPNCSRSGFVFNGWYTASSGGSRVGGANSSYTPSGNVTLYAQWNRTVTFDGNNGTATGLAGVPAAQSSVATSAITLSSSKPTLTGYEFVRWNTNASNTGTGYSPGGSYPTNTASATLYAIWNRRITYKSNYTGGSADVSETSLKSSAYTVKAANAFSRPGYRLDYWTTNADGTGDRYEVGTSVYAADNPSLTLYAQWKKLPTVEIRDMFRASEYPVSTARSPLDVSAKQASSSAEVEMSTVAYDEYSSKFTGRIFVQSYEGAYVTSVSVSCASQSPHVTEYDGTTTEETLDGFLYDGRPMTEAYTVNVSVTDSIGDVTAVTYTVPAFSNYVPPALSKVVFKRTLPNGTVDDEGRYAGGDLTYSLYLPYQSMVFDPVVSADVYDVEGNEVGLTDLASRDDLFIHNSVYQNGIFTNGNAYRRVPIAVSETGKVYQERHAVLLGSVEAQFDENVAYLIKVTVSDGVRTTNAAQDILTSAFFTMDVLSDAYYDTYELTQDTELHDVSKYYLYDGASYTSLHEARKLTLFDDAGSYTLTEDTLLSYAEKYYMQDGDLYVKVSDARGLRWFDSPGYVDETHPDGIFVILTDDSEIAEGKTYYTVDEQDELAVVSEPDPTEIGSYYEDATDFDPSAKGWYESDGDVPNYRDYEHPEGIFVILTEDDEIVSGKNYYTVTTVAGEEEDTLLLELVEEPDADLLYKYYEDATFIDPSSEDWFEVDETAPKQRPGHGVTFGGPCKKEGFGVYLDSRFLANVVFGGEDDIEGEHRFDNYLESAFHEDVTFGESEDDTHAFWNFMQSYFVNSVTVQNGNSLTLIPSSGNQSSILMPGKIVLKDGTAGTITFDGTGAKIEFHNADGSQKGQLIFSDYDVVDTGASLTWVTDQSQSWFRSQYLRATTRVVSPNYVNKSTTIDLSSSTNNVSGDTYGNYTCWDKADRWYAVFEGRAMPSGEIRSQLNTRNMKSDGTYVSNTLVLGVQKNGTRIVSVTEAAPWRNAISALGAQNANGYWGMGTPAGAFDAFIRTPSPGIIPYASGGSGSVGTTYWPFNNIYGKNIYVKKTDGTTDYNLANAVVGVSRSGTTFTATRANGNTFTFTQQDNNTTYSLGTSYSTFTMSAANIAANSSHAYEYTSAAPSGYPQFSGTRAISTNQNANCGVTAFLIGAIRVRNFTSSAKSTTVTCYLQYMKI